MATEPQVILFKNHLFRLATEADVPRIRLLANAAYREWADQGLNYTATYQDGRENLRKLDLRKAFLSPPVWIHGA